MIGAALFLFALLFLFLLIVLGFVFPIWMIVDCAKRQDKSGGFRAGWIVAMVFTYPLGGLFYGVFGAQKTKIRVISFLLLFLTVILAVGGAWSLVQAKALVVKKIPLITAGVNESEGTDSEQKQRVLQTIGEIEKELSDKTLFSQKIRNDIELLTLLANFLEDRKLEKSESDKWLELAGDREERDLGKLSK